ncbi:Alpha/Beta hydrolase protein [Apiospora saccharicola]
MGLPVQIIPPTTTHTHTVAFLHGRGDHAPDFMSSLYHSRDSRKRTLFEAFPSFRWWFDIWHTADFTEQEGLQESVAGSRAVLEREASILGGRWDLLVLAGISQGAATSVHTLLNLDQPPFADQAGPHRLGAFPGFSCRMPFPGRSLADTRKVLGWEGVPDHDGIILNTPVLLKHCADDPTVLGGGGRNMRDALQKFGAQVAWREYPQGGHWFKSPAGIDDAIQFLGAVLPKRNSVTTSSAQGQSSTDAMDLS